jgi:hypothetical protein
MVEYSVWVRTVGSSSPPISIYNFVQSLRLPWLNGKVADLGSVDIGSNPIGSIFVQSISLKLVYSSFGVKM